MKNENDLLLSILIPCYNGSSYILKAIQSILRQNIDNYEIIILDDKSTDETLNVLKKVENKNIKIFENDENMGLPYCRQKLTSLASGKYFYFLDDDDTIIKNSFKKVLPLLDKKYDIIFTKINIRFNYFITIPFFPSNTRRYNMKTIDNMKYNIYMSWGHFINKKYFDSLDIDFGSGLFEDIRTMPKIILSTSNFVAIRTKTYLYNRNLSRMSKYSSFSLEKLNSITDSINISMKFIKDNNNLNSKEMRKAVNSWITSISYVSLMILIKNNKISEVEKLNFKDKYIKLIYYDYELKFVYSFSWWRILLFLWLKYFFRKEIRKYKKRN